MVRALVRFFRTPPLALRIVLSVALAVELFGLGGGLASVGPAVRDAVHAGTTRAVGGTLLFAACAAALHAVLAAFVIGAALLARRVTWLSAALAIGPIAVAGAGARGSWGYSVALVDVQLARDTPWALLEGAAAHIMLAALAAVVVLIALPLGLIRRHGAEGGPPASNPEPS
jgi:hypothetical protein